MRDNLDGILAVSTVVVAAFGSALVVESQVSATTATIAFTIVLFASTATAWIHPRE